MDESCLLLFHLPTFLVGLKWGNYIDCVLIKIGSGNMEL